MPLGTLDDESAVALLAHLGVQGSLDQLAEVVHAAGGHAKAVECLALARSLSRRLGARIGSFAAAARIDASDEERHVLRILSAFHASLPRDLQDLTALATHFHQPPMECVLVDYLRSESVRKLLHDEWSRPYVPFQQRGAADMLEMIQTAVSLRLLERVSLSLAREKDPLSTVLDAHPLVRRGFEDVLGSGTSGAAARAGFLRGRPDRRKPANLAEARDEVELFHALCAAGLWAEADDTLRGLDNPKHRFLATPAFERDLLLRFFPGTIGDSRRCGPDSAVGAVWRFAARCSGSSRMLSKSIAPRRPAARRCVVWR